MVLRASGETDSILKYMIDYTSDADYETGYIDRHVRNKALYAEIERRFSDKSKKACGINVFEALNLFRDAEIDDLGDFCHRGERGYLPTMSEWFLSDNFVPTCYARTDTVNLAFGENVTRLSDAQMKNGVITDALAHGCSWNKALMSASNIWKKCCAGRLSCRAVMNTVCAPGRSFRQPWSMRACFTT